MASTLVAWVSGEEGVEAGFVARWAVLADADRGDEPTPVLDRKHGGSGQDLWGGQDEQSAAGEP